MVEIHCRLFHLWNYTTITEMAKVAKLAALLGAILVACACSSTVNAVDVIFYRSNSQCSGTGFSFNGLAERTCARANGGSVLFRNMDRCRTSRVYRNGGCDRDPVGSGTGNRCFVGGGYTSGFWFRSCKRRSLLGLFVPVLTNTHGCELLARPTGLVFTPQENRGSWMLETADAFELMPVLEGLDDDEKVDWMKRHGAAFDSSISEV